MTATLYEFTSANRERILERTIGLVAAHADGVPREQLTGSLPEILDDIVTALGEDKLAAQDALHAMASDKSSRQGSQRFHAGFRIEMIVRCFGALCDSITALAEEDRLAFTAHEFRILNQSIDSGIATAVETFAGEVRNSNHAVARERIGALAHELRNALSTVSVGFEALKAGRAGWASKTAGLVSRGLERMEALIVQTLAAAKLHSDAKLDVATHNLRSVIDEIVELLPATDVRVEVQVERDTTIEADQTLMVSAVGNLVQNAVKFTRPGGTVTVRVTSDDRGYAIIEVEDECGGLGVSDPESLFKPFHQKDPSRGGAGLGLAIVRDAVIAHGGTVEARDQPPTGCRFILHWPRSPRRNPAGSS